MYELIEISQRDFYIDCPSKIGIRKLGGGEVCLIDSGNGKDVGKKIRRILDDNGWTLRAIYNTHSHADHIGANRYLQEQTGCKVYAPGMECAFVKNPVLEPSFLYGGYPFKELRHRFMMAQESVAEQLTEEVLPEGVEALDLPGHSFEMVGFRTSEDVVYLADCLSGKDVLEKYGIVFMYDVEAYLKTLERVKSMRARIFVPAHAEATSEIFALAQYNIDRVYEIADEIENLCKKPKCFEEILKNLFKNHKLHMNFEQYALVGSTVRSYLAWLKEQGRISPLFEEETLFWEKC